MRQKFIVIWLSICISIILQNQCVYAQAKESPYNGEETVWQTKETVQKGPSLKKNKIFCLSGSRSKLRIKNAKGYEIKYYSENTDIASVDNGVIKALSRGITKVHAVITKADTSYDLVCTVIVQDPVNSLSLTSDVGRIYIHSESVPDEYQQAFMSLSALFRSDSSRADVPVDQVKWTCTNKKAASIEDGVLIAGTKPGKVKVTASYGGKKTSVSVVVLADTKYTGEPAAYDAPYFADSDLLHEVSDGNHLESSAKKLYVSPNGNDHASGNLKNPFQTVGRALEEAEAGTVIYLRDGTYPGLFSFQTSGEENAYIVLRSYPGEHAVLCGDPGKSGAVLALEGQHHIRIEDLEVCGQKAQDAYGILLNQSEHHIIVRNTHIHHIETTKPNRDGEGNAILCYGEKTTDALSIHDVWISDNEIDHMVTGWSENLSISGNCRNVNVMSNVLHDGTNIGIDFYGNAKYCKNPYYDQPRYCIAKNNIVYGMKCDYAECAGIYVDGSRDILIVDNVVYDNMYGIEIGSEEPPGDFPVKNILVSKNVVKNNPDGGIRIGGYDTRRTGEVIHCELSENVLENNGAGEGGMNGELNFAKCRDITVKKNIITKAENTYPMVSEDLPQKYVNQISFIENQYCSPNPDGTWFCFHDRDFNGIDAWNAYTGGSDIAVRIE